MAVPRAPPEGGFAFTWQPSLASLTIPANDFVSTRPFVSAAATGALVFSKATAGEDQRVLLIQRAPHDSMPLRWEIPGGACDPEDETMLHGLARELWEEAGLRLKEVVRQVGDEHVFLTRKGLPVAKVTFEVEVETGGEQALPEVKLDPNEHVDFLWATEEECELGRAVVCGSSGEHREVAITFTHEAQRNTILLGFKLRREGTAN